MQPHQFIPSDVQRFSLSKLGPVGNWTRRQFLFGTAAAGCGLCAAPWSALAGTAEPVSPLLSPGCRSSKVRIARIYLGKREAHWPTPKLDLDAERRRYEEYFRKTGDFHDIEFMVNELIGDKAGLAKIQDQLKEVDGILLIHLSMGVKEVVEEIIKLKRPVALFAAPYSGHEWAQFGVLRQKENGELLECFLTSDFSQLAVAVRPFRAMHHLRHAKILNLSTNPPNAERVNGWKSKFGTEVKTIGLDRMLAIYEHIDAKEAERETKRWISHAEKVVEPSRDEIYRSCRLALAFQKIVDEEEATALMVDCYGSMYRKLPAFPCVGFVRLNDCGFAGICESDLTSAMTFILLQGLSGRPGFISDPTMDESTNSIILAHCLGTRKMDGPAGSAAPYRLRTIMERQEGCVPQVRMRKGQAVTQALLASADRAVYFTGQIIDMPQTERGCRTKITVKVDGDAARLWQNWAHGLHRVTCYGNVAADLNRFCRYTGVKLVNEA
jgi:L-fucose isomerase-like protein